MKQLLTTARVSRRTVTTLFTGAALLLVGLLLVPSCDTPSTCPGGTSPCGNGCLIDSAKCCNDPSGSDDSFGTFECPGGSVAQCELDTDSRCGASRYCCAATGSFGSADCTAGTVVCNQNCVAVGSTCCSLTDPSDCEVVGGTTTPQSICPATTPLVCPGTVFCCGSGSPYLCGSQCWSTQPTTAQCSGATVVCEGTTTSNPDAGRGSPDGGSVGGACVSGSYCYRWNCNGDSECLSTNPGGTPTGAVDEGNEVSCNELLTFGQQFWGIPPATQSCTLTP